MVWLIYGLSGSKAIGVGDWKGLDMRAGSVGRYLVMPRSRSVDPTSLHGERAWVFLSSRNRSMSQGAQKGLQARRYCAAGGQRLVYRQGAYMHVRTTNHVSLARIKFHITGLYL